MIPYGRQSISEEDINLVKSVLESDFLTQGPFVPKFEEEIALITGAKYCIAANSATSCLHLGCLSLGIGRGDIVWTSPISFVASSNAALYCGATVDFVDIDEKTFNICPETLEQKLKEAESKNSLPKLLIVVHMCGNPADMRAINKLSIKYGFKIMEDASHAIGSSIDNIKTGSCKYSDLCVFSFHPVKIITTGEGGAITTNNKVLSERMQLFRSHGITRDSYKLQNKDEGPWFYEQHHLGYNYRLTDIQAALGLSQLKQLDNFVKRRNSIARLYTKSLAGLPIYLQEIPKENYSSYHLFVMVLDSALTSKQRIDLFEHLHNDKISANVHYIPIHLQPYYVSLGFKRGDFLKSEKYYTNAITVPIFPSMTSEMFDQVKNSIHSFFR